VFVLLELRSYQIRVCSEVWSALSKGENALLQGPTGMGKSIIVAAITIRLCETIPKGRVLILIDREILVRQLAETFAKFFPHLSVGVVCASVSNVKDHSQQITIATRQTIINHLDEVEPYQLLIADEAHLMKPPREGQALDQYGQILDRLWQYNPKMRLFGCSATPYRLNNGHIYGNIHHPLDKPYFDKLTAKITYEELTKDGHLAPLIGEVSQSKIDLSDVALVAGEYNLGQLSECMILHVNTVLDAINEYAKDRKKIMIFCVDIKHAEMVANVVGGVAYHSNLSKDQREEYLESFKRGDQNIIVSVATLTTGFDYKNVDCVIMARPTKSASLFMQMIGRGLRPGEGKENCLLIDLTDNTVEHLPTFDLDRVTVNIPRGNGSGNADNLPVKICPGKFDDGTQCLAELHPAVLVCPVCGHRFEKEIAEVMPTLQSVSFDATPPPPPEWYEVEWMEITIHESKLLKELLKVTLSLKNLTHRHPYVYVWICTDNDYEGFAVTKGKEKWNEFCDEEMPDGDLVERLWFALEHFSQPVKALCSINDAGFFELHQLEFVPF
jgi:DNA repair protein RadD